MIDFTGLTEVTHEDLLYILGPLIFGSYIYMWHSFNKVNDRVDRLYEHLTNGKSKKELKKEE